MSAPPADRVRLADPAELIAAVPHLIGFHPHDSLVLISLEGRRLGMTLRADLVGPEHDEQLAAHLLVPLQHQPSTGVVLLVVGGSARTLPRTGAARAAPDRLPHGSLVEVVDDALAAEGIAVQHALWTASTEPGAPWICYDEPDCAGTVADPAASPMAAASVAAGAVTFGSRQELAALLAPDPPEALARRSALLEAADADHPLHPEAARRRSARLGLLHAAAARGALELDDETAAEAASSLCDHRVRDACLEWSGGAGAPAAEQLWLALVRATPAPERAEPAALLACTAYLRGDGALAGLAVDAALRACPDHALAALLRAALDGGLPPALLRGVTADAAAAARTALAAGDW